MLTEYRVAPLGERNCFPSFAAVAVAGRSNRDGKMYVVRSMDCGKKGEKRLMANLQLRKVMS